jgi:hypothetical protein
LDKVQFDSMAFQERNGTCGMKPESSGQNLAKKSRTYRDLKWDEICSVLFCFLNWYGMFWPFQEKWNEIDNLGRHFESYKPQSYLRLIWSLISEFVGLVEVHTRGRTCIIIIIIIIIIIVINYCLQLCTYMSCLY